MARAVCESTARTGGERPYHGRTQRRGCARVAVAFGFVPRALSRSLVGCGARSRRGQRRHWPIVVVALWTVFRSAPWSRRRRRRCVGRVLHPTLAVQPSLVSAVCVWTDDGVWCGGGTRLARFSVCASSRRAGALAPFISLTGTTRGTVFDVAHPLHLLLRRPIPFSHCSGVLRVCGCCCCCSAIVTRAMVANSVRRADELFIIEPPSS